MKKIIISGATSFLGVNTLKRLISDGYYVYALVRKNSPNISKMPVLSNLKIVEFTFNDLSNVASEIENGDVFINYAWDSSGGRADSEIQEKNINYSMQMLQLSQKLGCKRFIFPGSQAEYGRVDGVIDERCEPLPISAYGKSKLAFASRAKEYAVQNNIEFVHLRIFSIFGYGDRPNTLIDYCIKSFLKNETAYLGPCTQYWNYLYIDDFVRIISLLIENDVPGGIYNVASEDTRVMRDFIKQIKDVTGCGEYVFRDDIINAEKSPSLRPDVKKLKSVIGDYDFLSFSDAIKLTVAQYLT